MIRLSSNHDDESSPVSLSIEADPQPIPLETIVNHGPDFTAIARRWAEGDAENCRLCPRENCYFSPGGMCQVTIRGFVPTVLAPLRPLLSPGLSFVDTARLARGFDRAW